MVAVGAAVVVVDVAIVEIDVPGAGRITRIRRRGPEPCTLRTRKCRHINRRNNPTFIHQAGQLLDIGQAPTRLGSCLCQRPLVGKSGGRAGAGGSGKVPSLPLAATMPDQTGFGIGHLAAIRRKAVTRSLCPCRGSKEPGN